MPLQTIRLATALFLVLTLARAQYVAVRVFPRAQNNTAIVDGGTDSTATSTNAAVVTTTNEASTLAMLSTSSTTTEAASTTSESTTAATGNAAATTSYASSTSVSAATSSAASTTLTEASSNAAAAGPTAQSTFSASTTSATSSTASTAATTLTTTTASTASVTTSSSFTTEAVTASSFTLSSTTASATSTILGVPTDIIASATATVGFTTFSATSTGVTFTGPTIPPSTCASGSACCRGEPPVQESFCVGTGYQYNGNLNLSEPNVGITEPFTLEGSLLFSSSVMQISSPTIIRGNLTIDATSVLSLTQVPGLTTPLLIVLGSVYMAGTIVFNHDPSVPLLKPFMFVTEDTVLSGSVVLTLGETFSPMVPFVQSARVIAEDPDDDDTTINFVLVFNARPDGSRKRSEPQIILVFNTSQALSIETYSTVTLVSPRYNGQECDDINAPSQNNGGSLAILVDVKRTCSSNGGLDRGVVAGIVVGGVLIVATVILLGVLAIKKGVFRRLFNEKQEDSLVV